MKKTLHRFTALALVLVLLAGLCLQALAMWPAPGITSDGDYLDAGTLYGSNGKPIASKTLSIGGFVKLYVLPQGSAKSAYTMTPAWQWCTQVGSFPLATRSSHRSHRCVGMGR